jgi:two-component system phosphate regulon sensor histidine kinase PhoR
MSPLVVVGVGVPLAVLVLAALVALTFGAGWGFGVLALGLGTLIGHHLWQLHRLARWADTPLRRSGPRGRRRGPAFSALYRRTRTRTERQRDLATTIEQFRVRLKALPDGMVIIDAANRIQWANARAQATSASMSPRMRAGRS